MMELYRCEEASRRAAVHVLIVGVGGYPNLPRADDIPPPGGWPIVEPTLGLVQLRSAAQSAKAVGDAILRLGTEGDPAKPCLSLPLGSIRMLLSPTDDELDSGLVPTRNSLATLQNLQDAATAWRDDASRHPDSVTLFYFAGHGVQAQRLGAASDIMLLHDFGRRTPRVLESSFEVENLVFGMRPSSARPRMATRQLTLIDACRVEPALFRSYRKIAGGDIWDVAHAVTEDGSFPVVHSTMPGTLSHGHGTLTFFAHALLKCIAGGAARPPITRRLDGARLPWQVSVRTLIATLQEAVRKTSQDLGRPQDVQGNGLGEDFELCSFPSPPPVDVVLRVQPPEARSCTSLGFCNGVEEHTIAPPIDHSPRRIPAGEYRVTVRSDPSRYGELGPTMLALYPPSHELPLLLPERKVL